MRTSALRLGLAAAALLAGGCATSRQCAIPEAPLAPPPAPPLPARVGVAYPDGLEVDSLPIDAGQSSFRFHTGPAAVAALNRVAAQLFTRPVGAVRPVPAPGGPEAVLSFTMDGVETTPGPFQAEAATVRITGVLRDARGEVARASATGQAAGPPPPPDLGAVHCEATGPALGDAIARAAAQVRDALLASPAVGAWTRDPSRAPWPPEREDRPLAAPLRPPPDEAAGQRRQAAVPRLYELSFAHASGASDGPYGVGLGGPGFALRLAWDAGDYVALGLHVAGAFGTATPPAGSGLPAGKTSLGLVGLEAMVRLRPGRTVRPWLGLTGGIGSASWSSDTATATDPALAGSLGVDLQATDWGWVRLGLTYTRYATSLTGGWDGEPAPPAAMEGTRTRVHGLWLTAGFVLDLGPSG